MKVGYEKVMAVFAVGIIAFAVYRHFSIGLEKLREQEQAAAANSIGAPAEGEQSGSLPSPFGSSVAPTGTLRDIYGLQRSLDDLPEAPATVLCFLGVDCPLANRVLPALLRLESRFRGRGARFVAVYSHEGEDLTAAASHALEHRIKFTVLKDFDQKLADAFGIQRSPEFCVLDGERKLRYRGRFSDQITLASTRPQATREDLELALRQVLDGETVEVALTEADGCLLDRRRPQSTESAVTYTEHIGPILRKNCSNCHRPGGMGPFALASYEDAVRWSGMIQEVTWQRRMPAWHADGRFGPYVNDRSLAADEIHQISAWVEAGTPRGAGDELPPLESTITWTRGQPDELVKVAAPFQVPAEGPIPYQYLWIPDEVTQKLFAQKRWLRATEIHPGVAAVTHHIMVYSVDPGKRGPEYDYEGCRSLGIYVPGSASMVLPDVTALEIPAGSRIVFEMHYTPNGTAVADQPEIGLYFTDQEPQRELVIAVISPRDLVIPPHEQDSVRHLRAVAPVDGDLLSLFPHQHLRGKSFRIDAEFPSGERRTLLSVPRMDFNWQTIYWLREWPFVPKDTIMHIQAHWDNSAANLNNPDPAEEVHWGPQSEDEMMTLWLVYIRREPSTPEERRAAGYDGGN